MKTFLWKLANVRSYFHLEWILYYCWECLEYFRFVSPGLLFCIFKTEDKYTKNSFNDNDTDYASSLSSTPISWLKKGAHKQSSGKAITMAEVQPKQSQREEQNGSHSNKSSEDDDEVEEAACCLCHCGVDCSDRALFFSKDRQKELDDNDDEENDYYFTMEDPYLDERLYDPHNALVYCDSCSRLFHQKCHFVPLLVVPRAN